ncbi:hypothetical protein CNY89_18085 [Amaricoccus sp. HAR-UPW-R2A-40]|nr:hypothetical protein CNY89_18085 [Amaricoccus sp. HAR-UPW-R2A-40]
MIAAEFLLELLMRLLMIGHIARVAGSAAFGHEGQLSVRESAAVNHTGAARGSFLLTRALSPVGVP